MLQEAGTSRERTTSGFAHRAGRERDGEYGRGESQEHEGEGEGRIPVIEEPLRLDTDTCRQQEAE